MSERTIKIVNKILVVLLSIVTVLILIYMGSVIHQVISNHIPIELRDLATLRAADAFATGINPYDLDTIWLGGNTPQIYQYTFLEPLLVAGGMLLTGLDSLSMSVILNSCYLLLATIIIGSIINERYESGTIGYLLTFLQMCIAYTMFWGARACFTIHADGLGVLCMALIYYILSKHPERYILIAVMSAMLFSVKQFYILIFFTVLFYYIFTNKKAAIKYTVACIITGILELVISSLFMPTYLASTIFSQFMSAGTVGSLRDAIWNFGLIIIKQESPVLVIIIIAVCVTIAGIYRSNSPENAKGNKTKLWDKIKIKCGESPYESAQLCGLIVMGLFLLRLAMNGMDGIKYINALLIMPVNILLWASVKYLRGNQYLKQCKWINVIIPILILAQAITPFFVYEWQPLSETDIEEWDKARTYASEYDADKMFLGPIASMVLFTDKDELLEGYYDDGQLQYFEYSDLEDDVAQKFPAVAEQKAAIDEFKKNLDDKICNEEFELIMVQSDLWCIDSNHLAEHYVVVDSCCLYAMVDGTEVQIWKRK